MSPMSQQPTTAIRWCIVAPASAALGWLLHHFGVPASWILGAIIASGAMALSTSEDLIVNKTFYRFNRGIIGIVAAVPLVGVPAKQILESLPAGLFVSFVTVGMGLLVGYLISKNRPEISPESGMLSMLAGGASMMPAIAEEIGADMRYVSLTQYLRLLAVSVTLPLASSLMTHPNASGTSQYVTPVQHSWLMVLLMITIAIIGDPIARRLHIPVPSVLGPLIVATIVSFALPDGYTLTPPQIFKIVAFMSVGWVCGGSLSVPALKIFARQLPATVTAIITLMGACALSAVPLLPWLHISYFEAYLSTSPGAFETVLALGSEGGAGPQVVAIQLTRMIAVLLMAGYIPNLIKLIKR